MQIAQKIYCLPGHGPSLHPPDELTSPLQVFPPYAGAGLEQLLDL